MIAGPWQLDGIIVLAFLSLFEKELKYIGFSGSGKQVRDILIYHLCQLISR